MGNLRLREPLLSRGLPSAVRVKSSSTKESVDAHGSVVSVAHFSVQEGAAVKIQAIQRGRIGRNAAAVRSELLVQPPDLVTSLKRSYLLFLNVQEIRVEAESAIKIQAAYRGRRARVAAMPSVEGSAGGAESAPADVGT